jgi:hypothetical protein
MFSRQFWPATAERPISGFTDWTAGRGKHSPENGRRKLDALEAQSEGCRLVEKERSRDGMR